MPETNYSKIKIISDSLCIYLFIYFNLSLWSCPALQSQSLYELDHKLVRLFI